MSNPIALFLDDLEELLTKHFKQDWDWRYESDQSLEIFSDSLDNMWGNHLTEWERRRYEK